MRAQIKSSAAIRHVVGDTMAERGRQYYKDGAVLNVVTDDSDVVRAEVKGSFQSSYNITLRFREVDDVLQVDCECSCPVAYDCKHAAAVMYWLMDRPLAGSGQSSLASSSAESSDAQAIHAQRQGDELTQWLATLDAIDTQDRSKPAPIAPTNKPKQHLYFMLDTSDSLLSLRLVVSNKAPQVHDETFTDAWQVINDHGQELNEIENQLLMQLNQISAANAHNKNTSLTLPLTDDCGPLLQQILASGHCYLPGEWRHEELSLAPGRRGTFTWETDADNSPEQPAPRTPNPNMPGSVLPNSGMHQDAANGDGSLETNTEAELSRAQRLTLSFEGSTKPGVSLLLCAPPFFLDAKSYTCGPIVTDFSPVHVARLLAAPGLSLENVALVQERLKTVRPLAQLPEPQAPKETVIEGVAPRPVLTVSIETTLAPFGDNDKPSSHGFHMDELRIACLEPSFIYDTVQIGAGDKQPARRFIGDKFCVYSRNMKAEQEALAMLSPLNLIALKSLPNIHPDRKMDECTLCIASHTLNGVSDPYDDIGDESDYAQFVQQAVPSLEEQGWQVIFTEDWPLTNTVEIDDWYVNIDSSDTNWFSVGMGLSADGQAYDIAEPLAHYIQALDDETVKACENDSAFIEALLQQRPFVIALNNGQRAIVPYEPLVTLFKALLALFGNDSREGINAPAFPIEAASLLYEAQQTAGRALIQWRGGERVLSLGKRLGEIDEGQSPALPPSFKAELRPYQSTGLAWFHALAQSGFGGVLADDMGLGKTVQALAFLAVAKETAVSYKPTLIVAPTSVLGNWHRELLRFAPSLSAVVWHGSERMSERHKLTQVDVVITSFGLVRRDHETLGRIDWRYLFIDEAQNIKNPQSATHRTLTTYRSDQRFALTGTPLENNLDELWSLLHMVVPGLLGKRTEFRKRYRIPIERHQDDERQRHLARLIRPFLLRRTKEEVASDLPEKIIIDETVTLSDKQAALYETIRVSADKRIRDALREKGMAGSQITILDSLLKMRQVCCDPQLVKLKTARDVTESAKRERCLELIDTLVNEGRRILVFSQFVSMLDILARDLSEQNIDYLMLTGKTRKRDLVVDTFQQGGVPVFLISLKAGGAGLNLTAADTVIIYDPWWNPAAEAQAMDRSHRIGQTKTVFVYRLLADQTLETSIQDMQKRKAALAKSVLDAENAGSMALRATDIDLLLAPMGS